MVMDSVPGMPILRERERSRRHVLPLGRSRIPAREITRYSHVYRSRIKESIMSSDHDKKRKRKKAQQGKKRRAQRKAYHQTESKRIVNLMHDPERFLLTHGLR